MLMRVDGHHAPDSTVLRALRRSGRVLPVDYLAERRQHAEARRAAFVVPPSGPNQVWQLDFSEFETRHGGIWRIGGVADYWSKLELGWHVSTTQNQRDAIETAEQAIHRDPAAWRPSAQRAARRSRDRRDPPDRARHG